MFRFDNPTSINKKRRPLSKNLKNKSYFKMREESLEKSRELSYDFTNNRLHQKREKQKILK